MLGQKKKFISTAAVVAVVFVLLNLTLTFFLLEFFPDQITKNARTVFGLTLDLWILVVAAVAVLLVLFFVWWKNFTQDKFLSVAFGLIFGGAIANLLMRIFLGYAVDFIPLKLMYLSGSWNVADFGIVIGALIWIFKKHER